ncbi:malate dehydrogenase [bacterium]|nr:malate dehydrogenase [bacterium]
MKNKVTVIGAGNVGATCGLLLAMRNLCDVVLIDIPAMENPTKGKALDIAQAAATLGFEGRVTGGSDYAMSEGSDIVVLTAGLARKPGMDRLDLLRKNADIVKDCVENAVKHSPDCKIIVVTNPIDVMVYHAWKICGFPAERVFGQAGVLDSSRYATFVSMEMNTSIREISAMVLGGHGDSMVPLPRFTTVAGVPITELLPAERIAAMNERTAKGGGEIVQLLGTGSAYYAPAASTVKMVAAVLQDTKAILPCSTLLSGQYGISDVFVGVPVKLGARGVEEILELPLKPDELSALQKSAAIYVKSIAEL